jgi:hypothetical protein
MKGLGPLAGACLLAGALTAGCGSAPTLEFSSGAFGPDESIPILHTCDGENVSPPLSWGDPPEGTRSFALIVDDPDAEEVAGKVWVHWTIFNIPSGARSLAEAIPGEEVLPGGAPGPDQPRDRVPRSLPSAGSPPPLSLPALRPGRSSARRCGRRGDQSPRGHARAHPGGGRTRGHVLARVAAPPALPKRPSECQGVSVIIGLRRAWRKSPQQDCRLGAGREGSG